MYDDDLEGQLESLIILLIIAAIFIMKFIGIITIPWIWLLSPLWLGAAFLFLLTFVIIIRNVINNIKRRKENERY